jgi:hypothetical protein
VLSGVDLGEEELARRVHIEKSVLPVRLTPHVNASVVKSEGTQARSQLALQLVRQAVLVPSAR